MPHPRGAARPGRCCPSACWDPAPCEDYLAIGITRDALITRLARSGSVVVRPTRSVLRYAGASVDPREAGRELQVEAVLDGTIQRQGDRLRLTLQLVPLSSRFRPWAGTFEEQVTHVFAVQDAAAEAAARALASTLGGEADERVPPPAPAPRRPRDQEAYHAYLRGRYFWSRLSGAWLQKALWHFQEAAERDPAWAPPHAGLADAYLVLGLSGVVPPRDAWPLARASAARALELDAGSPEAQVSLGAVSLFERWDWEEADRAFARAEALDPHSAGAQVWRTLALDMRGRLDEAARARGRAAEVDPLSPIVNGLEAFESCLRGDHHAELELHRRARDLDPGHFLSPWGVGLALQHLGRHEEAVGEHERAVLLSEGSDLMKAVLARTLALAGRREEAGAIAAELDALPYFSPYQRSTVSLALGDRARALADIERARDEQDPWLVWMAAAPCWGSWAGAAVRGGAPGRVGAEGSAQSRLMTISVRSSVALAPPENGRARAGSRPAARRRPWRGPGRSRRPAGPLRTPRRSVRVRRSPSPRRNTPPGGRPGRETSALFIGHALRAAQHHPAVVQGSTCPPARTRSGGLWPALT